MICAIYASEERSTKSGEATHKLVKSSKHKLKLRFSFIFTPGKNLVCLLCRVAVRDV